MNDYKDPTSSQQQFIQKKFRKDNIKTLLPKITMCINLKALNGIIMLNAMMKKIQLQKELFVLDVEDGNEIYIPSSLS